MENKGRHMEEHSGRKMFWRAVILTASAVLLILIGYFSAGYFSGGL